MLDAAHRSLLREGTVIPAHPLALTADLTLDEARQRGLTDYYLRAGAGGVAVGVHTTQFQIHDKAVGLYEPVLRLAAEQVAAWQPPERAEQESVRPLLIAGVVGPTGTAVAEAELARSLGYDMALVAMPRWRDAPDQEILAGIAAVGEVLPVFGFYLQPALSGRRFGYDFWRALADIDAVAAIKIAPFDRYATLMVMRAVIDAGRSSSQTNSGDIAFYTGNDDTIVTDLLTPYLISGTAVHIVGGLLGQWAVWTRAAVQLHRQIRDIVRTGDAVPVELLTRGAQLTDANSAVFDSENRFAGSIAGVNEVLAREGVLAGNWCLATGERLSPGQAAELDRVIAAYPDICRPQS